MEEVIKFFKDNHKWAGISNEIVEQDAEILRKMLEVITNRQKWLQFVFEMKYAYFYHKWNVMQ